MRWRLAIITITSDEDESLDYDSDANVYELLIINRTTIRMTKATRF